MKVERAVDIAAPPEAVYDLISDPARLGEWVTIHQYAEGAGAGELHKGDTLTQCLKLAGQKFKVRWEVVESDRPHRLVWKGRGPGRPKAQVENALTPNGKGTTF